MAGKQSRFIIGLFVSVGILIGVAALVWLGASQYFEGGSLYVTYFDESVQGLQVDSRVKYRGVDIGKVERIGVAADQKLVEVIFKVDLPGDLESGIVTQLRAAGITGIVFIELDRRIPEQRILQLPPDIHPPYPVIPSQPSQVKLMLSSADRIMERLEKVDLGGMGDQFKASARAMETFFVDGKLRSLIGHLDASAASLERSLGRIDSILATGKAEGVMEEAKLGFGEARLGLSETRKTVEEARKLIVMVQGEVGSLKVGEKAERAQLLLERLDRRTKRATEDFGAMTEEVRQAVDQLRELLRRLKETPSDLIFSTPSSGDEASEVK